MMAVQQWKIPVNRPARILPLIFFSQFTGPSLWFAGNAVILDLQRDWGLAPQSLAYADLLLVCLGHGAPGCATGVAPSSVWGWEIRPECINWTNR